MKYEITGANLQYAYRKLKNHYYYYQSSNFLKKELLQFEDNWNDEQSYNKYFETLAKELLGLENRGKNKRISDSGISYQIIPKKDKFESSGLEKTKLKDFNIFINIPVKYHLLDILFILNVYDKLSDEPILQNSFSFGNSFDDEFIKSGGDIKNPLLFGNYSKNYMKWKNMPFRAFHKESAEQAVLVKFDLKKCYYNFQFNVSEFVDEVFGDEYSLINEIEIEIHNLYTYIVYKEILKKEKERNNSLLPVGLLSSGVICNYYLYQTDQVLAKKSKAYSRYADDYLVLLPYREEYSEINGNIEFLKRVFPEEIVIEKDILYLRTGTKNLPINDEKIKIILLDKKDREHANELEISEASFYEDYDLDTELINDPVTGNTVKMVRSVLFDTRKTNEETQKYISEMDAVTLLNAFPVWNSLFEKCAKRSSLKSRIKRAIDGIVSIGDDFRILTKLKECLYDELKLCFNITKETSEYRSHYLYDITQKQLFDYIAAYYKQHYIVFPCRVTKTQIMLYLQAFDGVRIDSNLETKVVRLYNLLNNLNNEAAPTYTVDNQEELSKINISRKRKMKEGTAVKVAVVNLNMPVYNENPKDSEQEKENQALLDYDFNNKYPASISEDIFYALIDQASEQHAKYIVFPEFGIPFSIANKVLKHCYKRKISLVGGLTHVVVSDDKAINCTLVYSFPISKTFVHIKKYLPESEIKILKDKKGLDPRVSKAPYFVIDDNELIYSVMTCYELTNIADRALMKNMVNTVFVPVYNRDTTYFSNIISSFGRDIKSYIVQSNINGYGDSRIFGPFHSHECDIVKLKGGKNNYFVVGELDINRLGISGKMPSVVAPGNRLKNIDE